MWGSWQTASWRRVGGDPLQWGRPRTSWSSLGKMWPSDPGKWFSSSACPVFCLKLSSMWKTVTYGTRSADDHIEKWALYSEVRSGRNGGNRHKLEHRKFWLSLKENLYHHEHCPKMAEVAETHCENSILGNTESSTGWDWSIWLKGTWFEQRFGLETSEGPFWPALLFDSMLYCVLLLCILNHSISHVLQFSEVLWKGFHKCFKEECLFWSFVSIRKSFAFSCGCWDQFCQRTVYWRTVFQNSLSPRIFLSFQGIFHRIIF